MKKTFLICCVFATAWHSAHSQEATSGLDLRATVTAQMTGSSLLTQSPRYGLPAEAGFRSVFYPVYKVNENWSGTAAFQAYSRPYFYDSLGTSGQGFRGNLIQASLNYSRVSKDGSLLVRAGQLSTAFGSFLLRYDDADNAVVDLPLQYGYYYEPVSVHGLLGIQVDGTRGKWDGRAQFTNSSPANPRSITAKDQYGNWCWGGGFTPRQGLRIGGSGFRGPYLDRNNEYFLPGEISPSKLSAYGYGFDANWTHAHWTVLGEWQRVILPYTKIPIVRDDTGYAETRVALSPRWYAAMRGGYISASDDGTALNIEGAAGFRPNRFQVIKLDYEVKDHRTNSPVHDQILSLQVVTSLHAFSLSRH